MLGALTVTCTTKKESKLTYPVAVVAAHQEQHYRTALWCVYTSRLDGIGFNENSEKARVDSIQALQRQLLTVKRHLKQVEKRGGSLRFEFDFSDFKTPVERALMSKLCGYSCGINPYNRLSPVAAVWVNEKDGLIDSVLNFNNLLYYAGSYTEWVNGQRIVINLDKRKMSWNRDEPYKTTFLQQNKAWLNTDLLQLCRDKNIVAR